MVGILSLIAALPIVLAAPIVDRRITANTIPNSWIVRFDASQEFETLVANVTSALGITPKHTYNFGQFRGASIQIPDVLAPLVEAMPFVTHMERDAKVQASALVTQSGATWGLGRISHRNRGSTDYVADNSYGANTFSYIIDTGILTSHSDFGGRATFGANFAGDGQNTDGNGHGTHVAGTVGSNTYGVAKRTNLIAVKVLDSSGSGSNSGVIAGINWAANNARQNGRSARSVANLSLGGGFSQQVNDAVTNAVNSGLFMAVAAGNENQDANNVSPASAAAACTVGATDINDRRASFSNYGSALDIFAPGVNVLSTWNNGGTRSISGTSMASPHIAGLGAYLIALEGSQSPAALCNRIKTLSTKNVITDTVGSVNYLAYNGNGA